MPRKTDPVLLKLTEEAAEIFGGKKHAQEWMETYSIPLGKTPREFLEQEGVDEFRMYLGRLQYNVCS